MGKEIREEEHDHIDIIDIDEEIPTMVQQTFHLEFRTVEEDGEEEYGHFGVMNDDKSENEIESDNHN